LQERTSSARAKPDKRADLEVTRRLMRYIDERCENAPTLQEMSEHVSLSPFYVQRLFKRVTGLSPREYAEGRRFQRFKANLRDGSEVAAALYDAGFGSSSRAYERAREKMGMTPAVYRRGGENMYIGYWITDTVLGRLLVATTAYGVCSVHLGDSHNPDCDAELVEVLHAEYPLAHISRNHELMCDWVNAIVAHVNAAPCQKSVLDLPLDLRATAFQLRVWQEVRRIPIGETRTYGEIAAALGHPGAASAVADAIDANPVAIIVPCHRAERKDGSPSRYYSRRAKVAREAILAHERGQAPEQP
jgi:AraC family transcriptional regulator, regulatory protein of adaptative response / methylated-DNA-[protein]-cysteine methyltransferase